MHDWNLRVSNDHCQFVLERLQKYFGLSVSDHCWSVSISLVLLLAI